MTDDSTITVYWSTHAHPDRQTKVNLTWLPPTPLITTLSTAHESTQTRGNYRLCSGAQSIFKNTYTLIHPKTSTVLLTGDVSSPTPVSFDGPWIAHTAALKNRYRVDYDYGWVFFCEESLHIKTTPPYMHNTSDQKSGFVSSGTYDIGKWFRPIFLSYILWEGESSLTVTESHPAIYIEFLTNKKVILKQFEQTPELTSMAVQTGEMVMDFPLKGLDYWYERFQKSHRKSRILKLIKENLLE